MDEPKEKAVVPDAIFFLTYGQKHGRPSAHRLTHQESLFIKKLLAGYEVKAAAKLCEIPASYVKEIMSRPEVIQYLEERIMEQAAAAGLTQEKVMFAVNHLIENPNQEVSPAHLKALDLASKILKMVQPNTVINNTIHESQFKGMDDAAFAQEFQKRMDYREVKEIKHDA